MADKTATVPPCDSCGTTSHPTIPTTVQGILVRACTNPTDCRLRAEAQGIWRHYVSETARPR